MQANTSTAYFNSPKFDLIELTALLTIWLTFMFKGLTATLYSIVDWLEDQIIIQFGIQGLTLTESQPVTPTIEPVTPTIDPVDPVETTPTIDPVDPTPTLPDSSELTYKDLQAMLKEYRDTRGEIQIKLNANKSKLLEECKRLGLTA